MTDTYTKPHLLITSDDKASALLIKTLLAGSYRVTTVKGRAQTLAALRRASFDLLLIDTDTADSDGFALLKTLHAAPEYAHLPVVVISKLADNAAIARGLNLGASDYIPKPLDRAVLQARVGLQIRHKRLMDAHREAIDELQAIQQMRDRFFTIASHDLRNPMNNIRMAHFLLRSLLEDNEQVHVLLNNIDIALDSMDDIVRDFLETAALQSQALDITLARVSAEDILKDVLVQYSFAAHKKDISLKLGETRGEVMADAPRLKQVISNLVSNAIKYSPPGAEVTLAASPQGDMVRICITDKGPGIPDDERDRLFSAFGKLSTRPTAGENSTGLGLWIVKQLTALQHGRVGVECPPSGGAAFWVDLPTWKANTETQATPVTLIIDDEQLVPTG